MNNENEQVDIEEFRKNAPQMTSNKLCEIIVANRYLKIMGEQAIISMEELALRRVAGDDFLYEKHIEQILETLPKYNLDINKMMKLPRIF